MSGRAREALATLQAQRLDLEAQINLAHFDPDLSHRLDRLLVAIEVLEAGSTS
jgi:hypothetical protein